MTVQLLHGDCRDVLRTLADGSVHCCITSPPYWGLRSYLPAGHPDKAREIGSEPTVHEWVRTMVEVFREVRRVLRPDGTLWLNLGDSYAGSWGAQSREHAGKHASNISALSANQAKAAQIRESGTGSMDRTPGLKPKDLIGQPWRVAFALQEDGWWLRQELIWAKRSPMPESVRDRFTKSHETVFLLAKAEHYYFDADAVQEPASGLNDFAMHGGRAVPPGQPSQSRKRSGNKERKPASARGVPVDTDGRSAGAVAGSVPWEGSTRNPRSVRWLASEPFRGAHFATYPPSLIEPFVLAGCPPGGTILDPFGGSGTTGLVADRHGRNAVLIDIDERNLPMARDRIRGDAPLFAEVAA